MFRRTRRVKPFKSETIPVESASSSCSVSGIVSRGFLMNSACTHEDLRLRTQNRGAPSPLRRRVHEAFAGSFERSRSKAAVTCPDQAEEDLERRGEGKGKGKYKGK